MPIIQCDITEGRTEAQKRALAREITKAVQKTIDAPLEFIYVVIREQPRTQHMKGDVLFADWLAQQQAAAAPVTGAGATPPGAATSAARRPARPRR